MGKSPGKWLKTLLFGKKTSRSGHAKPKTTVVASSKSKRSSGAEVPTKAAMGAPLPSQPVPVSNQRSISITEPEKRTLPNVVHEEGAALPVIQEVEILEKSEEAGDVIRDLPDAREIQAAIKAQTAFRGYLARRAFQALKGIIRLQGLVRGHLVRRQAVATLLCLQSIIKLQTIIHARVAIHSNLGHAGDGRNFLVANTHFVSKLSASSLIRKILARHIMDKPLSIKYSCDDPNSEWIWLERWTAVCCDGQVIQSQKGAEAKRHRQTAAHSSESESNKVKRSVRTRSHSYNDSISNNSNGTESEKAKRSFKKTSSRPVDIVQEQPQNELEKVKRSLRKVSLNSVPDLSADQDGLESEKSKGTSKRTTHPSEPQENADAGDFDDSLKNQTETDFLELAESIETKIYAEPASIDISVEGSQTDNLSFPLSLTEAPTPGTPSADSYKDGTQPAINGALNSQSKDDQACLTSKISSKRRSSFPGRVELVENGLQTPTLPSYMAATESAKAKLRAQGSPRFGSDVAEQNGVTRRHSLPSLSNGKITSFSPRTQRLAQATGKGALKDRSLLSSRDGTEKVEWRR